MAIISCQSFVYSTEHNDVSFLVKEKELLSMLEEQRQMILSLQENIKTLTLQLSKRDTINMLYVNYIQSLCIPYKNHTIYLIIQ